MKRIDITGAWWGGGDAAVHQIKCNLHQHRNKSTRASEKIP